MSFLDNILSLIVFCTAFCHALFREISQCVGWWGAALLVNVMFLDKEKLARKYFCGCSEARR